MATTIKVRLIAAWTQYSGTAFQRPCTTKECSGWVSNASYTCGEMGTYLNARTGRKQYSKIHLRDKLSEIKIWCSKTRGPIPPIIAIRLTVFTSNGWLHSGRSKSNSSPCLGKYKIRYTGTSIPQHNQRILTKHSIAGDELFRLLWQNIRHVPKARD